MKQFLLKLVGLALLLLVLFYQFSSLNIADFGSCSYNPKTGENICRGFFSK